MANTAMEAQCCIVGGGPAGMMLGNLLARSGVDVGIRPEHAEEGRSHRD